jgi:hypothetical protein
MTVFIRKIYDLQGQETGSILSAAFPAATTPQQKFNIESKLIDYAFTTLYAGQGLSIYRDMYVDTPSVTVIKEINNLPQSQIIIP